MNDKPQRVQLKRSKGWRIPPNTVVVSRPSRWGNPFNLEQYGRQQALIRYERWIKQKIQTGECDLSSLRGKNLACWCKLEFPCHADILLRLAN